MKPTAFSPTTAARRCRPGILLTLPIILLVACSDSAGPITAAPVDAASQLEAAAQDSVAPTESGTDAPEAGPDVQHNDADAAIDTTGDELPADGAPEVQADDAKVSDVAADLVDAGPAQLGSTSIQQLAAELPNKDFLLINVHVPYAGEIPQTDANITYQDIAAIESFIGPKLDTKVVVYCLSNYMSLIAGNALVADGYSNVRYLDGGLSGWQDAGNPVEYHDH